jgi:hypothetical protein
MSYPHSNRRWTILGIKKKDEVMEEEEAVAMNYRAILVRGFKSRAEQTTFVRGKIILAWLRCLISSFLK